MKNFIASFLMLLTLLPLARGANPSFTDFNANQFGTSGNKVAVKSGAKWTNVVSISGLETNYVAVDGTNFSRDGRVSWQHVDHQEFLALPPSSGLEIGQGFTGPNSSGLDDQGNFTGNNFTGNGAGLTNLNYTNLYAGSTRFAKAHVPGFDNLTNTMVLGNGGTLLTTNSPWGLDGLSFTTNYAGNFNTFIGFEAGVYNRSGLGNTFIGESAGYSNVIGTQNTFVGWDAGKGNSNGYHSTYLGAFAGFVITTNNYNVFVGTDAGLQTTNANFTTIIGASTGGHSTGDRTTLVGHNAGTGLSGTDNTSVGQASLNGSGSKNVAVGVGAGGTLIGNDNVLIGYRAGLNSLNNTGMVGVGSSALQVNNSAAANVGSVGVGYFALAAATNSGTDVAIGYQTLTAQKSDGANVGVGFKALPASTTSSFNVGIGYNPMANVSSGSFNIGIGRSALNNITTQQRNTGVGYQVLFNAASPGNTALGYTAGITTTSGSNNVFIGHNADTTLATAENSIGIGYRAVVSASHQTVIGNTNTITALIHGAITGNGFGITNIPPGGAPITNYTSYAAGTAYSLTATPAQLDFGTTDPSITISLAGTYLITGNVGIKYNGATYAGAQTATVKFRRTNNTAADLSNGSRSVTMPVLTTFTGGDTFALPSVVYTATLGDIIQIFGSLSSLPAAGTVDTDSAEIVAIRLY